MERGHTIKVLDHGYVKLIDFMGSDEAIVEDARMSTGKGFIGWGTCIECQRCKLKFPKQTVLGYKCVDGTEDHDWKDVPGDEKLLAHLYVNKHTTPFETGGEMKIEVQAPLFVFREWHRHRTQSYNEFSARYAQMPDLHYVPELSRIQKQSTTNKQGSGDALDEVLARAIVSNLAEEQSGIYEHYEGMLEDGVAKEVARINTPVSRYSKMRAKTDLHNWLGFLRLRHHPAAQWEIRQYAAAVAEMVKALWPRTWELFAEHDLGGVRLSKTESALLLKIMNEETGYVPTKDESDVLRKIEKKLSGVK